MIDAVNLMFLEEFLDFDVQRARRIVIAAKGLLDNHSPPLAIFLTRQSGVAQLLDTGGEESGGRGEVVKIISARSMFPVRFGENALEIYESGRIREIAGDVVKAPYEPMPDVGIHLAGGELANLFAALVAELFGGHFRTGESDQREFARQEIVLG
jgi:hypothetical protein